MGCCGRTTPRRDARGQSVIKTHRAQRSFGDGQIAEEVKDLHEAWMKHADQLLGDPQIVAAVYEALAQRHPQSRKCGRPGTRPRWCCVCWCSSTCATGVTACSNGRCAPIWYTAISPAWAAPRCPTPRPWANGGGTG